MERSTTCRREHLKALAEGSSEGVDCRADIYGLGVVLFEASPASGRLPRRAGADRWSTC